MPSNLLALYGAMQAIITQAGHFLQEEVPVEIAAAILRVVHAVGMEGG